MEIDHLKLLQMQINALYAYNTNNRIVRLNEPDQREETPLFVLSRCIQGNICRYNNELPDTIVDELEHITKTEPVVSNLREPVSHMQQYVSVLNQHSSVKQTSLGPSYYLPKLNLPAGTVNITFQNENLLEEYFPYTLSNINELLPVVAVVEDGKAVSICRSVRTTKFVAEAGVDTVDDFQGLGYATKAVSGWAEAVRTSNKIPLYSTSWDNLASQAIAKKLHAIQYGDLLTIV